jgi:hypothetical protein
MKSDIERVAVCGNGPEGGFNFDLEKLRHAVNSPTISFHRGMTGEQRRAFLRARIKEIDGQVKP